MPNSTHWREIAFAFLKVGSTAFGGPAAHIAMMNEEFVKKRRWLTREQFLDLLSSTNFIPGPNSTEMAIHIGYLRGGWRGLVLAGASFILPSALIVTGFAWAYVQYGSLPLVKALLYGIKPVIIAIVLQAVWSLARIAIKNRFLAVLATTAFGANFFGLSELLVISICGFVSLFYFQLKEKTLWAGALAPNVVKPLALSAVASGAIVIATPVTLAKIFLSFLKVGSVLFGSGYVLLAFLRTDLVERWHWLSESQLIDAIAVGQLTPGPVFTTATFIGYILASYQGALLATLGIFLPAFFFVAISAPFVAKLRTSPSLAAALDGVNGASLAVMTVTTLFLAREAVVDFQTLILTVASAFLLLRFQTNTVWLVGLGGLAGVLMDLIN